MSIKLVIDMNLSPDWVPVLSGHGWQAIHWSAVGDPRASDRTIMNLLPNERPCWRVTWNVNGTVTLHPSVWRRKDCGSHFWLRNGRIRWC